MAKARILIAFGTRPEAIKLFPLINELRRRGEFDLRIAVTAQHRELLDQVLAFAQITPDYDLDLMQAGQSLDELAAKILTSFGPILDDAKPDRVLVHGDTMTTVAITLACYLHKVPVGHVEAGLRSGDNYAPWPEECFRKIVASIADLHIAPTQPAANALKRENIDPCSIFVTGNTVIDALQEARRRISANPSLVRKLDLIASRFHGRRIIAVTTHRRENLGAGMKGISDALRTLARREDTAFIFPAHPIVARRVREELGDIDNIAIPDPLDYPSFVRMMELSSIILTDSGGVQEEAPSLGKPLLVLRDKSERPEGIEAGTAKLVGTDPRNIVNEVTLLLDNPDEYEAMARAHNPYGDGTAAVRIAQILSQSFGFA